MSTWGIDTSFAKARDTIIDEVRRFGGRDLVVSSNIPLRRDGYPYANFTRPDDSGVAIYFTYQGEQVVFACDKWRNAEDNLQAIRKAIEAFRGLERWGVSDLLKRAFTGFKALPERASGRPWWEVLDCPEGAGAEIIKEFYRAALHRVHPDKGGTAEQFAEVQEAYKKALQNL